MTPMPMPIYCDNQETIFIPRNLAFHERTKKIEIDCHFIRDKVLIEVISIPHVSSSNQLINIFTKSIIGVSFDYLGSKVGMFDLCSSALGEF